MPGIFISYRREDTAGHAGRLFDHLSRVFGSDDVFMDVDDIQRGDTFSQTLNERVQQSDVLLAVIGRQWLSLADAAGGRRLDAADDWVRAEIRGALTAKQLVIPVLVGGAALPAGTQLPDDLRGLVERQMADVRDGSWNDDVGRLCNDIKRRRQRGSLSERVREHWVSVTVTAALVLLFGGYALYTTIVSGRTAVPLVSGLALDRATRALSDAGLEAGDVSKRATNEFAPGSVIEQSPAAQTAARRGGRVSLVVAAPKAVDLTPYVSVRDVGSEGTVAAAALATAMDASLAIQGRPGPVSMRYIYEKSKKHDEVSGEGTFLETTIYVARQFGAPPEEEWPYQSLKRALPGGVTWPELDTLAAINKAQITQVAGIDGILAALDKGSPVIVAANATESWSSAATGVITPQGDRDQLLGATVITLVAFDPATGRYKFANNWGATWGDKGFGYFTAADAMKILLLETGLWAVKVPAPVR